MSSIIKKITLDLGKKEIVLTVEQAQKLKAALDELFGKEVVREVIREDHHYPMPLAPSIWPQRPWYWDRLEPTYYQSDSTAGYAVTYSTADSSLKIAV